MTVVYKYPFAPGITNILELPRGAKALHADYQHTTDQWCLWAEVDPTQPNVMVPLYMVETGQEIPDTPRRYLNSVLTQRGTFVFHFYIGA
jgi:hypothetical protein